MRRYCLWAVGVVWLTGCDAFTPPPFDPRGLDQPEVIEARTTPAPVMRPLPTTLESPFLPSRQWSDGEVTTSMPTTAPTTLPANMRATEPEFSRRLTLQQIIHLAVLNSLDVRVAGYQPAIDSNKVIEAQAKFDATYYVKYQYQNQASIAPSLSDPTITPLTAFISSSFETGLKQTLPDGTQAQLSYTANGSSSATPSPIGPTAQNFYSSELDLQITQPLLNNWGPEINQAGILIAQDTERVSLLDARLALEKNVADIESAYWQLVLAQRTVEIQEALLERTWSTASLLFRRRGQDSSNVEISEANSHLAARWAQLARAQAEVTKQSDKIKSLMNDPQMPTASPLVILPGDEPVEDPVIFDMAEQIQTALENRAELAQQQVRVDAAEVTIRAAKTNLLPTLNLTLSGGIEGVGGNYANAVGVQVHQPVWNYGAGIDLEVPVGNRAARAIYQRSLLQRLQAVDQYRNIIEKITDEVKDAQRDVSVTWEEVRRNRQARFAAAEALRLLEQREPAVVLSPEFVTNKLSLQSDLADAQRAEIEALTNYNVAISALERAKGTILRYNNIRMAEEPSPYGIGGPRR